jgi:hypothetical protein
MEGQALQARIAAGTLEPLLSLPAAPLPTPAAPQPIGGLQAALPTAADDSCSDGPPPKRHRPAAGATGAETAFDAEGWPCVASESTGGRGGGCLAAGPGVLRHTAPIAELLQATQDRLYSRLFNS